MEDFGRLEDKGFSAVVSLGICCVYGTYCGAIYTSFLEEAIAEVTPEMLVALAIIMFIAPVMAFLSLTLKDSINRWANIIVGIVFAGLGLFGAIEFLASAYSAYSASMTLIGIVEVVFAALIVWYAWKSKQKA